MKKTLFSLLLVAIILVSTIFIGGAFAAPTEKIPVIIGFKDLPDAALIHANSGEITHQFRLIHAISSSLTAQAISALQKNPRIAYVEEDIQVTASTIELDNSWGVKHIGAGAVQQSGNKGGGINVAVLDTGINYNHEELIAAYKGGIDIINNDANSFDDNGHGTHCAGIIAAADNNNDVVVGVAPQVNLYSVKVLNSAGSGSISTIIAGIQWAVDNHMQVISMSLGASTGTSSLQQACDNAYNQGVLVVAASGNDYRSTISYPARYASVIAVGATDSLDKRASFSNYGTGIELMAPGVNILSTYIDVSPNDNRNIDVVTMSGTSMATPHVAGVAALVLASPIDSMFDSDQDKVWDASEVRAKLQSTADDLGAFGKDNVFGYGLVDAVKATTNSVDNVAPTISSIKPADGSIINTAAPTISATISDSSGIASSSIHMLLGDTEVTPTINGATVSYQATSLSEGSHQVSLAAADTLGNTGTKTWTFTTDTIAPAQVTGLTTVVTSNRVDLSWNPVIDAATYKIIRDNGAKVATANSASYSDTGLTPSTTYSYSVTAVDSAGNVGTASDITVKTSDTKFMHVESIVMALKTSGSYTYGTAAIKIVDASNTPLPGATVTGKWSSATTDSDTAKTNSAGTVTVQSNNLRNARVGTTFVFTVTGVTLAGYTFSPSLSDTNSIKK